MSLMKVYKLSEKKVLSKLFVLYNYLILLLSWRVFWYSGLCCKLLSEFIIEQFNIIRISLFDKFSCAVIVIIPVMWAILFVKMRELCFRYTDLIADIRKIVFDIFKFTCEIYYRLILFIINESVLWPEMRICIYIRNLNNRIYKIIEGHFRPEHITVSPEIIFHSLPPVFPIVIVSCLNFTKPAGKNPVPRIPYKTELKIIRKLIQHFIPDFHRQIKLVNILPVFLSNSMLSKSVIHTLKEVDATFGISVYTEL